MSMAELERKDELGGWLANSMDAKTGQVVSTFITDKLVDTVGMEKAIAQHAEAHAAMLESAK